MHAVAYVGASISDFNVLVQSMCAVVSSQLEYVQCSSVPNYPRRHAESLLDLTLMRPLHTSGRNDGEAVEHDRAMWKRNMLLSFANGDWRSSNLRHFCAGCCADRSEVVAKMTRALSVVFLEPLGATLPSTNTWWTIQPTM